MVSFADIRQRKDQILRIAEKYGAHDLRVFGSILHTKSAPHDLDLLVRMDHERSLLDRISLAHEMEDLLGCPVDVVNERALHPAIRDSVLDEAQSL